MTNLGWRFGRFSLVGFMGAVLQLLLISLLTSYFGILSVAATPIAVEIAILHNFVWHERFTWSDRGPNSPRPLAARLGRFHVGNGLISLCGNTILVYYLVERLKAPAMPTAIGGIVLCSLANFWLADRWVYKNMAVRSAFKHRDHADSSGLQTKTAHDPPNSKNPCGDESIRPAWMPLARKTTGLVVRTQYR